VLSSAAAPAVLTFKASTGDLLTGAYTASVTIASAAMGVTNSPQTIDVSFLVSPPPAVSIAISTQPVGSTVSFPLTTQPVVQLFDANGSPALGSGYTVTATYRGTGSALTGTTTVPVVNGIATFADLGIPTVGDFQQIVFTSGSLTVISSIMYTSGLATRLVVTPIGSPPIVASLQKFSVAVTAQDANQRTVPTFTAPITVSIGTCTAECSESGTGSLSGVNTLPAVGGRATFSDLAISGWGWYTITVSAGTISGSTTAIVQPLPPVRVVITTQPTDVVQGALLPFAAELRDVNDHITRLSGGACPCALVTVRGDGYLRDTFGSKFTSASVSSDGKITAPLFIANSVEGPVTYTLFVTSVTGVTPAESVPFVVRP
jgi:hypothetical protein